MIQLLHFKMSGGYFLGVQVDHENDGLISGWLGVHHHQDHKEVTQTTQHLCGQLNDICSDAVYPVQYLMIGYVTGVGDFITCSVYFFSLFLSLEINFSYFLICSG